MNAQGQPKKAELCAVCSYASDNIDIEDIYGTIILIEELSVSKENSDIEYLIKEVKSLRTDLEAASGGCWDTGQSFREFGVQKGVHYEM